MLRRYYAWPALLAVVLLLGGVAPVAATPEMTFDQLTDLGTLSWAGGTAPLIGAGIAFDSLIATDTPLNSGVQLTCIACTLGFTTGNLLSSTQYVAFWDGGGSFTLSGTLKNGSTTVATGILMSGTWLTPPPLIGLTEGTRFTFAGFGPDTKNTDILAFYGLSSSLSWEFGNTTIGTKAPTAALIDLTKPFSVRVTEADVTNAATTAVPEPGSLLLLGSGISALVLRRRRKA